MAKPKGGSAAAPTPAAPPPTKRLPAGAKATAGLCVFIAAMGVVAQQAYDIRMYAIRDYGYVIHEFDPWFNYRATEYLAANGWHAFFHWFDYMSWYPLGRPVGTTIYPGMQITAVAIWRALGKLGSAISLNDVCCLVPAWFGVSASILVGLFAAECSGRKSAGAFAALIMAIVPAHIMRSVAGGFDNESVATTALVATFYCWVRALRDRPTARDGEATADSYAFGVLCGLAYVYMVSAWGGYVFVVNMIGAHAAALAAGGRYSSKLHRAYSLFYVIGTAGATRVPPVGLAPLRSLEQMLPLLVFLGVQLLEAVEVERRKKRLTPAQVWKRRVQLAMPAAALLVVATAAILPTGYFGPLSSRVRGLFLKHTRTGNPLVDSVAEHQPGSTMMYRQYLQNVYPLVPCGFALSLLRLTDANTFLLLYGAIAYFFASKMARLVILLGPPASAFGGVALGFGFDFLIVDALLRLLGYAAEEEEPGGKKSPGPALDVAAREEPKEALKDAPQGGNGGAGLLKSKPKPSQLAAAAKARRAESRRAETNPFGGVAAAREEAAAAVMAVADSPGGVKTRLCMGLALALATIYAYYDFHAYCHRMAEGSSRPQIMFKATYSNGQTVMVDDYREAYWWLRDKTPEDARVMAWWDYGYQITGIANRTSVADGNTWNHEHIATLGRILTAPQEEAHSYARHLADYVLVWAGGGGDDLAKSPHLARIGNSVFHGHCGNDPTCSNFGFYRDRSPTPMMEKSLLYKLVLNGQRGVAVNSSYFEHAYSSKHGKVRIYKVKRVSLKSKLWAADPANRVCDAPGSWYCVGQYPPALQEFINSRRNFKQLEDFNVKRDAASQKYHEEYMRRMGGGAGGRPAESAAAAAAAAE